jgi:hypothetical protein
MDEALKAHLDTEHASQGVHFASAPSTSPFPDQHIDDEIEASRGVNAVRGFAFCRLSFGRVRADSL